MRVTPRTSMGFGLVWMLVEPPAADQIAWRFAVLLDKPEAA